MLISTNHTFDSLWVNYDYDWYIQKGLALPQHLQEILWAQIILNEYGIWLKSFYIPHQSPQNYRQIDYEDDNHFHISDGVMNQQMILLFWITMSYELAMKFYKKWLEDIRIWFSFQTREMSKAWAVSHWIYDENDFYDTNDRISFYLKRPENMTITDEDINLIKDTALLIIDL